jgi:hypothetical protein
VSQGLAGVRKAAREHKAVKFTALLQHATVDLLGDSFGSLKRKAAPGVYGMTWQEYETGLEDRITDMDEYGIAACVLSAPASVNNAIGQEARDLARRTNEIFAEVLVS